MDKASTKIKRRTRSERDKELNEENIDVEITVKVSNDIEINRGLFVRVCIY